MLSESEQRRLAAIEVELRMEDPEFVHRFSVGGRGRPIGGWRGPAALAACLAAVTAAGVGFYLLSAVVVVVTAIAAVRLWSSDRP